MVRPGGVAADVVCTPRSEWWISHHARRLIADRRYDALLAGDAGRGVDRIDRGHVADRVGSFRGHGTATCDSLYKHCELIVEGCSAGQRVLAQPAIGALYNG